MDFKEPLMDNLRKINQDEFNVLIDIPKFFKEPGPIIY